MNDDLKAANTTQYAYTYVHMRGIAYPPNMFQMGYSVRSLLVSNIEPLGCFAEG